MAAHPQGLGVMLAVPFRTQYDGGQSLSGQGGAAGNAYAFLESAGLSLVALPVKPAGGVAG